MSDLARIAFAAALALPLAPPLCAPAEAASRVSVSGVLLETGSFAPAGAFAPGAAWELPSGAVFTLSFLVEDDWVGPEAFGDRPIGAESAALRITAPGDGALLFSAGATLLTGVLGGPAPFADGGEIGGEDGGTYDFAQLTGPSDVTDLEIAMLLLGPEGAWNADGLAAAALEAFIGGEFGVTNFDDAVGTGGGGAEPEPFDAAFAQVTAVSVSAVPAPAPAAAPLLAAACAGLALLRRRKG